MTHCTSICKSVINDVYRVIDGLPRLSRMKIFVESWPKDQTVLGVFLSLVAVKTLPWTVSWVLAVMVFIPGAQAPLRVSAVWFVE